VLTTPHRKSLSYYEVFHKDCDLKIILRGLRWAEQLACMGSRTGTYGVLVRIPEGKRPLGNPRRRWEDNIKIQLQRVGWGEGRCMDWIAF
jgi:hypothetical protein